MTDSKIIEEKLNAIFLILNAIILVAFMTVFHVYDTYPLDELKTTKFVLAVLLQIVFIVFLWLYIVSIRHDIGDNTFMVFSIITLLLSIGYILAFYIVEDKPVVAQQSLQRSFNQPQRSFQQPQQTQQPINHLQTTQKTMTLPMTENILTSSPTMYDKVYSEFTRVKNKYL